MSRFLALSFLAACSLGQAAATKPTLSTDEWLTRWVEARHCLVADAENTQTGVAIALLLGRRCDAELAALGESTSPELAPAARLTEAIWVRPSVAADRATAIEAMDRFAISLGRAINRDVSPTRTSRSLPVLRAQRQLELDGAHFGGGQILSPGMDEVVIDHEGKAHEYQIDGGPRVTGRDFAAYDGKHLANAEAGNQRVVVWTSKVWTHAYELDVSADGGTTWTKVDAPDNTDYLTHWQDPQTRAIELLVRDSAGKTTVHRITAQQPTPAVRKVESTEVLGAATCAHGGQHWGMGDIGVVRFGERPMRLSSWARLGQLDCRGGTALVTSHYPDALERCTDRCTTVFSSPNNVAGRGALLDDGRWIYAAVLDRVVGVWTEGVANPAFFRLGKDAELQAITVLGGMPALVLNDGKSSELVSL